MYTDEYARTKEVNCKVTENILQVTFIIKEVSHHIFHIDIFRNRHLQEI